MNNVIKKKEYIIHIDLEEKDALYDDYNWHILNDELARYINKQISKTKLDDKIILEISAGFMKQEEKVKMRECIINHYQDVIAEIKVYNRLLSKKQYLLLFFGILGLIVSSMLDGITAKIIVEVLNIAGWVGVWEAIYSIIFTDSELKFKQKRAKQIIKSEIIFK